MSTETRDEISLVGERVSQAIVVMEIYGGKIG
jgi:hypothetical protein